MRVGEEEIQDDQIEVGLLDHLPHARAIRCREEAKSFGLQVGNDELLQVHFVVDV